MGTYLWRGAASGLAAGACTGFFGAGGGMLLVFLLEKLCKLPEQRIFPASVRIMLPICLVSLVLSGSRVSLGTALPYLLGSLLGGLICLKLQSRVSPRWLHRGLGILMVLGGGRMLWT